MEKFKKLKVAKPSDFIIMGLLDMRPLHRRIFAAAKT